MLREGSSAKNLQELAAVGGEFIVSDDKHPEDLLNGHVDVMLRKAVEYGIDPIKAIKMVTVNPADHYNLNTGKLVPNKAADLVCVNNLEDLTVERVIIDGYLVAQEGKPLFKVNPIEIPSTFQLKPKITSDFDVRGEGSSETVTVLEVLEGQLITMESISYFENRRW